MLQLFYLLNALVYQHLPININLCKNIIVILLLILIIDNAIMIIHLPNKCSFYSGGLKMKIYYFEIDGEVIYSEGVYNATVIDNTTSTNTEQEEEQDG